MLGQLVEYRLQHRARDFLTALDRMTAVHQDFRLDDRHNVVFLTERGVTGQRVRIGLDGKRSWNPVGDVDARTPLRKTRAQLVVLDQALTQAIETFGDGLAFEAGQRLRTGID